MQKEYNIELDIKRSINKLKNIEVKQGGNTSVFFIRLTDGNNRFEVPEGITTRVIIGKPDNTIVELQPETIGQDIMVTLSSNALAAHGIASCEVVLTQGEDILTSTRFEFKIMSSLLEEGLISSSELRELDKIIQEADEMRELLTKAKDELGNIGHLKEEIAELEGGIDSLISNIDQKTNAMKSLLSEIENNASTVENLKKSVDDSIEALDNKQPQVEELKDLLLKGSALSKTLSDLRETLSSGNSLYSTLSDLMKDVDQKIISTKETADKIESLKTSTQQDLEKITAHRDEVNQLEIKSKQLVTNVEAATDTVEQLTDELIKLIEQTDLGDYQMTSEKGQPDGYASLDDSGKVPEQELADYLKKSSIDDGLNKKADKTSLDNKVDKVEGKQLSSNDFTNDYKTKLDELEIYDDTVLKARITAVEDREDKDTTYTVATTTRNGLMSSADKTKLNGVETGAEKNSVTSVAGKTGAVSVTKADVGLGSVNNVAVTQAQVTKLNELTYTKAMTQSQYDALSTAEKYRADVWYGIYKE